MQKIIQWYDSTIDRYLKYYEESGELIATKMTEGPYADVEIVKKQPKDQKAEEAGGRRRKRVNYLANKDLLAEFEKSIAQDQMTDKFAMMLQMLIQRISKKLNYTNYCVDDKTEALTDRGWLKYNEITKEDSIVSYDPEMEALKWSEILDVFINETYSDSMFHLTSNRMDAFVTPRHKFITKKDGLVKVEELKKNCSLVLSGNGIQNQSSIELHDAHIKFIGASISGGEYLNENGKTTITFTRKIDNIAHFKNILSECNVAYKETMVGKDYIEVECFGDFVNSTIVHYAPYYLPSMQLITSISCQERHLLIQSIFNERIEYNQHGWIEYVYGDKKHIDAIQMLCSITGLITETFKIENEFSDKYGIRVFSGQSNEQSIKDINIKHNKKEIYNGTVWCPKTEYGSFMCRRGGKVFLTGNTYIDDMRSYAMVSLMSTWSRFDPTKSDKPNPFSYYTTCINHSFIQYLKKEKQQRDIRDKIMNQNGLNASHSFQIENSSTNYDGAGETE